MRSSGIAPHAIPYYEAGTQILCTPPLPHRPLTAKAFCIEWVVLRNTDPEISEFLSHNHVSASPRASDLIKISTWDHLKLHVTVLTALSFTIGRAPPVLTTCRSFSIVTSHPAPKNLLLGKR